jgi:hypothetical protein
LPVLLQVLESIFFLLVLHLGDWAEYLFSRFLSPLASPCFVSFDWIFWFWFSPNYSIDSDPVLQILVFMCWFSFESLLIALMCSIFQMTSMKRGVPGCCACSTVLWMDETRSTALSSWNA